MRSNWEDLLAPYKSPKFRPYSTAEQPAISVVAMPMTGANQPGSLSIINPTLERWLLPSVLASAPGIRTWGVVSIRRRPVEHKACKASSLS